MDKVYFEVFVGAADKCRWRLIYDNGNILADPGESYASKRKVRQGIESVKRNAPDADIIET